MLSAIILRWSRTDIIRICLAPFTDKGKNVPGQSSRRTALNTGSALEFVVLRAEYSIIFSRLLSPVNAAALFLLPVKIFIVKVLRSASGYKPSFSSVM